MARSGTGVGAVITIAILAALSLALFVLTLVFFGQARNAQQLLAEAQAENDQIIRPAQREQERVRRALDLAQRENRQSLVEYLLNTSRGAMEIAAGDADLTLAQLRDQVAQVGGADTGSLLDVIDRRDNRISVLTDQLEDADADRLKAQADAEEARRQMARIESEFRATSDDLTDSVAVYRTGIEEFREGYTDVEDKLRELTDAERADFETREDELQDQIAQMTQENLRLREQVRLFRQEGEQVRLEPVAEESLADGVIDQVIAGRDEVIINLGRKDKLIVGLTFAVYDNASEIRPNNVTGRYPRGKAVLEITRIGDNFSRARILSQSQGNPITEGDVIANAVYDPTKTYSFVVDGLFDIDNDGVPTALERADLRALIERWGGRVVDEVQGDLDFVVLGARPLLPPPPPSGSPLPVINEYVRLQREIERYEDLQRSALDASIPILNENRLQTLIGDFPQN